eukprot:g78675.t1
MRLPEGPLRIELNLKQLVEDLLGLNQYSARGAICKPADLVWWEGLGLFDHWTASVLMQESRDDKRPLRSNRTHIIGFWTFLPFFGLVWNVGLMSALGSLLGALAGAGTFPYSQRFSIILKLVDLGSGFSLVLNWIGFSIILSGFFHLIWGERMMVPVLFYFLCYPILGLMGTCVELCAWWRMTAATLLHGGTWSMY